MMNRKPVGADSLVDEMKTIIHHTEELLKATADQTGDKIEEVRSRATENLRMCRRRLNELQGGMVVKTKAAAKATDEMVHERPWQSMAIAAAASFVIGILAARRH